MCGHVGIAGDLIYSDEAIMKKLLLADYWRGKESTGLAALRTDGESVISKIASHPIDLFDTKSFDTALNASSSTVFLGHNRAATKGLVNHVNAHPFQFGHITGAHNGTLTGASHKDLEDATGNYFDVDSQAIFAAIEKIGIAETVPLLQGAWALVWINAKDRTLNFLRNKERSFWMSSSKTGKLFWASEYQMMAGCLGGEELWKNPDGSAYFATETDTHYSFDIETLVKGGYTNLFHAERVERKGKETASVVSYYNGGAPFQMGGQHSSTPPKTTGTGSSTGSGVSTHTNKGTVDALIRTHLKASKENPFNGYLSQVEINLAKDAERCHWCSRHINFEDPGIVFYDDLNAFLGSCCTNDNHNTVVTSKEFTRSFAN